MTLHVEAVVSEHPIPAHAVGACLGELLEAGGPGPVAVVVAVTEALVGALEDVVTTTRGLLGPEVLVAVTVGGVVGGSREVDGRAAVMMFALWDPDGSSGPVRAVRLTTRPGPEGSRTDGLDPLRGATGTLLLFADPFSIDEDAVLGDLDVVAPELRVVGGDLSAARYAGGNRLVVDGVTWTDGAVGVHFGAAVTGDPLVSRAARPIGPTTTVTAVTARPTGEGTTVVTELGGRPARAVLDEIVAGLDPELRSLAAAGLYLGHLLGPDHTPSKDQLSLLGVDADSGGLVVGGAVPVGSTVCLEVRDPSVVEHELVGQANAGDDAAGEFVGGFVAMSASRGTRFHGRPDGDATAAAEALQSAPLAGVVLGGEFAPVADRNRRLTSSVVVLPFR